MRVSVPPSEQKSGFGLAKPGQYELRVVDIKDGKGPKGPYLKFSLEILGATQDPDGQPLTGPVGHIFETCTLADGKRWRLANLITAAGFDPQECDTDELRGATLQAQVDIEKDPEYPARNTVKKFIDAKK
jgi:hypothetical protein